MTKHRHGTYSESYRAEISIPVATTLAGFVPEKEHYFVPRAHISFPKAYNHESIIKLLFPDYVRYKTELLSEKSIAKHRKSAEKLIFEIIPWLSTVLLQDGVLWMNHYPAISGVALLTSFMSEAQAITAFGSNYCNWVCTDGIRQLKELLKSTIHNEGNENDEMKTNIASLLNQQGKILNYMENSTGVNHPSSSASFLPILPRLPSSTISPPKLPTVNERLNYTNVPVIPIIWNINEYQTLKKLWSLREIHQHVKIENNAPSWLRPKGAKYEAGPLYKKKDQWCKIACIYTHIKKTFQVLKCEKDWKTEIDAAEFLDLKEKKKMTMNQYALYLKRLKRNK